MNKKRDWLSLVLLGVASAIFYLAAKASFVYPGESAKLISLWRGLDFASVPPHPVMSFFARLFGSGNLLAPVCGALSVAFVYALVSSFVRWRTSGEHTEQHAGVVGCLAGVTAGVVYMFSPAVIGAATHLEPRLFDLTLALGAFAVLLPWRRRRRALPFVAGALWGLLCADSALGFMLLPAALTAVVMIALRRRLSIFRALIGVGASAAAMFALVMLVVDAPLVDQLQALFAGLPEFFNNVDSAGVAHSPPAWLMVFFFSTLPFFVALFSSRKGFGEGGNLSQWIFHTAMGVFSIVAVATGLAPAAQMEPFGVLPVLASAFAAGSAGYLVSYWWLHFRMGERIVSMANIGVLAFVYVVMLFFNVFTFPYARGAFAEQLAGELLDGLGERKWLVSDGRLDDMLRIVADERGRELNLVCLTRDLDTEYLDRLSKKVVDSQLGGERSRELAQSLKLGVLPFVQDWLRTDTNVAAQAAVFGSADLWYSAGIRPVPETLFFGADPARPVDLARGEKLCEGLKVEDEPWGSYRLARHFPNPVDRMRLELRRHLGMVTNNRGVFLMDAGRTNEAYAAYAQVADVIDMDNICALFNLMGMVSAKYAPAVARRNELERKMRKIVDDPERRYRLWALANYYGYIRDPQIYVRLGYAWARSGSPGEALSQVQRAMDLVPSDKRGSLMNMLASLYAADDNRAKSRELYEQVLAERGEDHDALVGLMRLSIAEGNEEKAVEYLERAVTAAGEDPRAEVEYAMLALMKGDTAKAKTILRKVTDRDSTNMHAWSLLAAVTMQECDAEKDPEKKAQMEAEFEKGVLAEMEKSAHDKDNYHLQTTRAFALLRKGDDASRRKARDTFAAAASKRPDVTSTHNLVMGLDISLNDRSSAESHAKEMLKRDRRDPMANYVMGSNALLENKLEDAEIYLRRAVTGDKPVPLAMNDLAEALRRLNKLEDAETYARLAAKTTPKLYVVWDTLATVLLARGGEERIAEAYQCAEKAVEMSRSNGRVSDIRVMVTLARAELKKGDRKAANSTLRRVQPRLDELSEFERQEYDELLKNVR